MGHSWRRRVNHYTDGGYIIWSAVEWIRRGVNVDGRRRFFQEHPQITD